MALGNYIGLALIEYQPGGKRYLFEAPYDNTLEAGDLVEVDGGDKFATVIAADCYLDVDHDARSINMIIQSAEAELPLKRVRTVIDKRAVKYRDEEVVE
jgi:hypothetical protein